VQYLAVGQSTFLFAKLPLFDLLLAIYPQAVLYSRFGFRNEN